MVLKIEVDEVGPVPLAPLRPVVLAVAFGEASSVFWSAADLEPLLLAQCFAVAVGHDDERQGVAPFLPVVFAHELGLSLRVVDVQVRHDEPGARNVDLALADHGTGMIRCCRMEAMLEE